MQHRFSAGAKQGLIAAALLSATMVSQAAPISWGTVLKETGLASDVLTAGSLHGAVRAGSTDTTVNGVTFAKESSVSGGTVSFGSTPIKVYGMDVPIDHYGPFAPSSWDSGYAKLVSSSAYRGNNIPGCTIGTNCPFIEISNLLVGQSYQLQIFESYWNINWATIFTDGTNAVTLNQATTQATAPEYVTGSFTADGSTQRIYMNSLTDFAIFTAIQVRTSDTATVPEPTSLLLVGSALAALGLRRRR